MSHSQIYTTSLEQQLEIHKKHSPYKWIKIDPKLVQKVGIEAAAVYSALQYKFEGLVSDTESSQYEFLQENDGWFYMSQAQLVEKTGLAGHLGVTIMVGHDRGGFGGRGFIEQGEMAQEHGWLFGWGAEMGGKRVIVGVVHEQAEVLVGLHGVGE